MASLLIWVFVILGAAALGFILSTLIGMGWMKWANWRLKKKLPTSKKELADPGKTQIPEKEVEENERKRDAEFREYEKLRKYSLEGPDGQATKYARSLTRNAELSNRGSIPIRPDNLPSGTEGNPSSNKPTSGETKQRFKLSRPTDI